MFRRHYCTKSSDAAGVCSCDILYTGLPPKKTGQSFPQKILRAVFIFTTYRKTESTKPAGKKMPERKNYLPHKKTKVPDFFIKVPPLHSEQKRSMTDEATTDGGKRRPYDRSPRGFLHSQSATRPSHHTYCRLPTSS